MIVKTVKNAIEHWWISLFLGILFISIGICVLLTPLESYVALCLLFSISFFINGVLEIFFAIANRTRLDGWGWQFTGGIIDLLLGAILMSIPGISMFVFPIFVGFGLMFRAMILSGLSIDLRTYKVPGWGWLLTLGLSALVFSFMLIAHPVFAGLNIIIFTALACFGVGFFRIILALKLRSLHNITRI